MKYTYKNIRGYSRRTLSLLVMCCLIFPASGKYIAQKEPLKILNNELQLQDGSLQSDSIEAIKNDAIKRDLLNIGNITSINTISGKDIEKNTVYSLGNSLYGRLPGLFIQSTSAEPGSDSPNFTIRGKGTFGVSNLPLILVDGFERDLNMLSIEDIESISILKDAGATVLYGGKAANGVIAVTTKRGFNGKNKISFNIQQGLQAPERLPDFVSSAQYARMYNQALANDGLAARFSNDDILGFYIGDPYLHPNVNWLDEMIRKTTNATRINTNITGGNNIGKYYVSLGYLHSDGLYNHTGHTDGYTTNNNLDRFNFRSNLDINLTDDLKICLDMGGQIDMKNSPVNSSSNIWNNLYKYPSYIPIYAGDGVLGGSSTYPNNPMGYINEMGYSKTNDRYFLTSLKLDYDMSKVLEGLSFKGGFGYDNYYTVQDSWGKTFLVKEIIGMDTNAGQPILSDAIGQNTSLIYKSPNSDMQSRRFSFDFKFSYNTVINDLHGLNIDLQYRQDRLTLGPENPYNNQSIGARVNYSYKERYIVEAAASYSGTEAFAKDYRFGLFPAISAGWIISNEDFLKSNSVIDFLKLRGSAGMVGNADVGERFSYRQLYVKGAGYNMGSSNGGLSGIVESTLANPRMTFEKSFQSELGLEANLFRILSLSASLYKQHRTDILTSQSSTIPSFFGAVLPSANSGKVDVHGFDIGLNLEQEKGDWGYCIGINVSHAKSKIIYKDEALLPPGSEYGYQTGNPVSQPFGLVALGLFQSQEEIDASPVQQFGTVQPGDIKYLDMNNDGFINNFDKGPIGKSTFPDTELGMTLSGRFRNFDINALFQAQIGRDIYLGSAPKIFWALKDDAKISTYALNAWTEETKEIADYPRLSTMDNSNNYRASTFWYKNGDFLRLRSMEVGYNFSKDIVNRLKMNNLRLFVRGMNLYTWNKLNDIDPEIMSGYPSTKSYYLGVKVQF